jgi:hypothetical protein
MVSFQTLILTRDESRNPRLKAEGKDFGPLARLFLPSVFSLQLSAYSSIKMAA